MKTQLLKFSNRIIGAVLMCLGFTGCSKSSNNFVFYTVKGVVVNKANGKPVKGIWVGFNYHGMELLSKSSTTEYTSETHTYTNENGEFVLREPIDGCPPTPFVVPVTLIDEDGEENGGWFDAEFLRVDFEHARAEGNELIITINPALKKFENNE
jgi:putative lipoprotein (rSAM/lipoprotein system)